MKKNTLTVAIPAFNEEQNIREMLGSLLEQKSTLCTLKEIIVYSDASTDRTHEIVRNLQKKNPIIKLKIGKKQAGKYLRMNQMFKECTSDILVVLDADIALANVQFLNRLSEVILKDSKAMMVAAHQVLLRPKSFIGKILHTNFVLWDFIRWSVPDYDNANNFYASATAFRMSFAKTINIPTNLSDPHLYLFLVVDKVKGFRYARNAEILQQPISTWTDFNKFLKRSLGKKDSELEKITGVNSETVHIIPLKYKIKGLIQCFRWQPFYTIPALLVSLYMKIRPSGNVDTNAIWDIVTSTKKPIFHAKK